MREEREKRELRKRERIRNSKRAQSSLARLFFKPSPVLLRSPNFILIFFRLSQPRPPPPLSLSSHLLTYSGRLPPPRRGRRPRDLHHQDHGRQDPGTAPRGHRRQGALHQGDRRRAARRPRRHRRALDEGRADLPPQGHRAAVQPAAGGRARRADLRARGDVAGGAAGRVGRRLW